MSDQLKTAREALEKIANNPNPVTRNSIREFAAETLAALNATPPTPVVPDWQARAELLTGALEDIRDNQDVDELTCALASDALDRASKL